jgi:hypothetical protein
VTRPLVEQKRDAVIEALLEQQTVEAAAVVLGIGRTSVYRFIKRAKIEPCEWQWPDSGAVDQNVGVLRNGIRIISRCDPAVADAFLIAARARNPQFTYEIAAPVSKPEAVLANGWARMQAAATAQTHGSIEHAWRQRQGDWRGNVIAMLKAA